MYGLVAIGIWLFMIVVTVGGWIANIVKLVGADVWGILELARAIGVIFAPLGVVLGLFV
jgi:hypothetical protein